ncbi:MAG: ATP-binding protein [Polaromonas sp.]
MTAHQLQAWLRAQFPKENERHEWKEWHSLKSNISGRKGEDLVSYVSALANMDGGGCVVVGAQDKTLEITGIRDFSDYTAENVVHRILGKTPGLPSIGLRIEELQASDTGAVVWLVHVPRHAPRQPVLAHDKAWQRDGDSLTELREDRRRAILNELVSGQDWSAGVVPNATLADLDPEAVAKAREKFADRHQQGRRAADMAAWSTAEFLDRAKITLHSQITRTALLLLGRPESVALLAPNSAEISWLVREERIAQHFDPPFLLTTTEVAQHIRNPNIKLFPATELLAVELPRYDNRMILEGLHNCVAHQDYEQGGRIVVLEMPGRLKLTNPGRFVDGEPEDYFTGQRTPSVYRNPWLARAMTEIGMIDKGGYGISEMVAGQRKRYLPLPDYEGSTPAETVFNIYGQAIDENYSKLLMERSDLPLEVVIWLDRVQKKHRIGADQASVLRRTKLIEGRKPNFFVAAHVADATNTRPEYTRNKGLDDHYYKTLILQHIKQFKSASVLEVRSLLLDKLPDSLTPVQKQAKVKNLLTALRVSGLEGQKIVATQQGKGGRWELFKP